MSCDILDLTLSSFVFDRSHPSLQRDRIGSHEERAPNFDARYDFHTLVYDAYFDPDAGEVILICPSLLNFKGLVEKTEFLIDGTPSPLEVIDDLARGSLLRFVAPGDNPKEIAFRHELFEGQLPINRKLDDRFADKNVVYAISKDNKLEWIQDWLTYYVSEHGANAVVLYDNHSTIYSMDALKETLSGVPGIEVAALVRAWFPFGPGGVGGTNFNSKFLHMTMVELGRRRLLAKARAVLNVDIDELVFSRTGQSIFDATIDSEKGYVRMDGKWVYADSPTGGRLIRHADHRYVRVGRQPRVNRKWCVAPQGPLQGKAWLTHRIISRQDPTNKDFGFWHFRRISSNWDYDREDFNSDLLVEDSHLVQTLDRVFG